MDFYRPPQRRSLLRKHRNAAKRMAHSAGDVPLANVGVHKAHGSRELAELSRTECMGGFQNNFQSSVL